MKVLITSGGGAKGAFSVGALKFLKESLGITKFDFISGTSTGSLIASMVACGDLETLIDVYLNTTNDGALKPQNLIDSLTQGKPFIYDTEPLMKQINQHITPAVFNKIMQSDVIMCLNAVCLQTGKITVFCNKEISTSIHYDKITIQTRQNMIDALLGSTNQPVFLNPIQYDLNVMNQYVDGGNREVIPTRVVVDNLRGNEDHEIYILSNNPNKLITFPGKEYKNILEVLLRATMIFVQEVRENDLEILTTFKKIASSNVKIFEICPDMELDPNFPTGLNFDPADMGGWMSLGEIMAEHVTTNFPNGNLP